MYVWLADVLQQLLDSKLDYNMWFDWKKKTRNKYLLLRYLLI